MNDRLSAKVTKHIVGPGKRIGLSAAALLMLGCGSSIPLNEQSAEYFGLMDQAEFVYETEAGQEMQHTYDRTSDDEKMEFFREATQGGFMLDEQTMILEATDTGLQINQFYDCLTRCGQLSEPIPMFQWPLEEGDEERTEVTVELSINGEPSGTVEEVHRFAVGTESTKTLPIGDHSGFEVIWTRTQDGVADSAALFLVPELGFGRIELFSGGDYSLSQAP